jgi:hypothetical protein
LAIVKGSGHDIFYFLKKTKQNENVIVYHRGNPGNKLGAWTICISCRRHHMGFAGIGHRFILTGSYPQGKRIRVQIKGPRLPGSFVPFKSKPALCACFDFFVFFLRE